MRPVPWRWAWPHIHTLSENRHITVWWTGQTCNPSWLNLYGTSERPPQKYSAGFTSTEDDKSTKLQCFPLFLIMFSYLLCLSSQTKHEKKYLCLISKDFEYSVIKLVCSLLLWFFTVCPLSVFTVYYLVLVLECGFCRLVFPGRGPVHLCNPLRKKQTGRRILPT